MASLTKVQNSPLTTTEKRLMAGVRRTWKWQRDQILRRVKMPADIPFVEAWHKHMEEAMPAIRAEFLNGGKEGLRQINFEGWPWTRPAEVDNIVRRETMKFAKAIDGTVHKRLRGTLRRGLAEGLTVPQLRDEIAALYDGWSKYHAELIARTESIRALNKGKVESWKKTGVVVAKVWDAAGDACVFCLDMHGTTIELDKNFFEEGDVQSVAIEGGKTVELKQTYGNLPGPPLHPNCRCTLTAVTTIDAAPKPAPKPKPSKPLSPEKWKQSLSQDDIYAITEWEEDIFKVMEMRADEALGRANADVKELNRILKRAPQHKGTMYRGIKFDTQKELDAFLDDMYEAASKGDDYVNQALSSFTKKEETATWYCKSTFSVEEAAILDHKGPSVLMRVQSKTGRDIQAVASIPEQAEIIAVRGTRYQVTHVVDDYIAEFQGSKFETTLIEMIEV